MTMNQGNAKRRLARLVAAGGLIVLYMAVAGGASAQAAIGPFWDVKARWGDTNLPPGGEGQVVVQARNVGDEGTAEAVEITDQLPAGVVATGINWGKAGTTRTAEIEFGGEIFEVPFSYEKDLDEFCSGVGTETVTCVLPEEIHTTVFGFPAVVHPVAEYASGTSEGGGGHYGNLPQIAIDVEVDENATGAGTNVATVSGGGATGTVTDEDQVPFSSTPSKFGVVPGSFTTDTFTDGYPLGEPARQAGDRPFELRVKFDINEYSAIGPDDTRFIQPNGLLRTVEQTMPRGFYGNPEAMPACDPIDFVGGGAGVKCPPDTQVGYITVALGFSKILHGQGILFENPEDAIVNLPVYNLERPYGVPIDLAFSAAGIVQAHIYPSPDPAQNYALLSISPNIANFNGIARIKATELTIWGVPGDPAHDRFRIDFTGPEYKVGAPWGSAPIRPFLTNPMDCGFDNGGALIRVDSYEQPGQFSPTQETDDPLNVEGCDDPRFRFEPEVALQPTSRGAGGPTGLDVHLEVPQRDDVVDDAEELYAQNGFVKAIPTPPMKKAVVSFPEGMTINPAAAQGLGHCTPEQIGLGTSKPVTCPDSSQYGTLTMHTPLFPKDAPLEGHIYIAQQNENPFHNFLSLYLVIQEPERGQLFKIAGRVDLDPETGQITTTFDDLPQYPLSDLEMNLKGGLRAGLVNPQTCGRKTITAEFFSWHDPGTPRVVTDSYEITENPDGSPCLGSLAERPFEPRISGGTLNNVAGSFSPLELTMTRSDKDQELAAVEGSAPPGLLASLKGLGRCSDAQIAAAANPERTGTEEQLAPSCPSSSLVGTIDAGAGVGQVLTYVKGKLYLAGPYKGAPLSGVAIVPAVAGPFDLGVIVSRAPAYVNPRTAELSLKTDPLPLIFKGVPVRVRDIRVHVDRSNFVLNPTSCDPMSLTGVLFSSEGKSKVGGSPFQAADCASLGFRPRLATRLFGGTKRGAHPKFKGIFRARPGDANVSGVVVTLPRSEFLDQSHIKTICTRVQFAADACPAGSIYGHATATTPLLDERLSGPVYMRSSDNKLPDIVADLHGIVDVEVVGRVDSIRGGIRTTFEQVPDAPVDVFTITMQGGKKGLLVNSRDICERAYRLDAKLKAHNGKRITLRPALKAKCKQGRRARQSTRWR
jgi:hypothetical protein